MSWKMRYLSAADGAEGGAGAATGDEAPEVYDPQEVGAKKHRLKIKGKEELVDYTELVSRAQRVSMGDKALSEASALRKEAQEAKHLKAVKADIAAANKGDVAAVRRLKTYEDIGDWGFTPEWLDNYESQLLAEAEAGKGGRKGRAAEDEGESLVTEERLAPEVRKDLERLRRDADRREEEKAQEILNAELDKTKELSYALSKNEKRAARLRGFAFDTLMRRAREAAREGRTLSRQDLRDAIEATVGYADDLGVLKAPEADEETTRRKGAREAGLGRSSLPVTPLHRSSKPIERVAATDRGYKQNLMDRMLQRMHSAKGD